MIFERYRDLFEDCAPVFWPWLWLQLAWLIAQKEADGRDRLIMVAQWGQLIVLATGDAPTAPHAWTIDRVWDHVRPLRERLLDFSSQGPDETQGSLQGPSGKTRFELGDAARPVLVSTSPWHASGLSPPAAFCGGQSWI